MPAVLSVRRMEKSGSGRSRLAARAGLPVLRLEDFYCDGADPFLVRRWLVLLRDQRQVVDRAVARGCEPLAPDQALARIAALHRG